MVERDHEISTLLRDWSEGDPKALGNLMPLVFDDLRRIASVHFAREPMGHTLQPTAVVNELFLRLVERRKVELQNRAHFFGFAAQLVRHILVDHARGRKARKRGGDAKKVPLSDVVDMGQARSLDLVALDDALTDLARIDPRGARIVEMRFFGGLTHEEVADILKVAPNTVRRRWTAAKAWLYRYTSEE